MNLEDIPSVRRNPVIADIFAQLGYMERKGSGMGKIINPIIALPYFEEKMLPSFFLRSCSVYSHVPQYDLSLAGISSRYRGKYYGE